MAGEDPPDVGTTTTTTSRATHEMGEAQLEALRALSAVEPRVLLTLAGSGSESDSEEEEEAPRRRGRVDLERFVDLKEDMERLEAMCSLIASVSEAGLRAFSEKRIADRVRLREASRLLTLVGAQNRIKHLLEAMVPGHGYEPRVDADTMLPAAVALTLGDLRRDDLAVTDALEGLVHVGATNWLKWALVHSHPFRARWIAIAGLYADATGRQLLSSKNLSRRSVAALAADAGRDGRLDVLDSLVHDFGPLSVAAQRGAYFAALKHNQHHVLAWLAARAVMQHPLAI